MILHCEQFEQNDIIAACPSSWNYSVSEGCGWVIVSKMPSGVSSSTADNAC